MISDSDGARHSSATPCYKKLSQNPTSGGTGVSPVRFIMAYVRTPRRLHGRDARATGFEIVSKHSLSTANCDFVRVKIDLLRWNNAIEYRLIHAVDFVTFTGQVILDLRGERVRFTVAEYRCNCNHA